MMELDAMEMKARNGTKAVGVASLIDDDGVKGQEGTLMAQMGKKQQLNV